ncbi:MAG: RdgB/HAM1 family non-canonical purine NTP pyrophosphatase [Haliscomenobacter sp.]
MKTLIFATGNPHKVAEVNDMLHGLYEVKSLADIGCTEEIPETADTLEGNAKLKAAYVRQQYGLDCFAEDTGLEVDALDGAPGVFSARYAGEGKDPAANLQLLLENLRNEEVRSARFRTVIALHTHTQTITFEGVVEGQIARQPSGVGGFGYDPVFIPNGYTCTFSEMSAAEKHAISHRGKAVRQLLAYLKNPR